MKRIFENILISIACGKKLKGSIRKPEGNGPFPAILFVHGLGMTMHEWNNSFDEIAVRLREAGFITLQFQFDILKLDGAVRELPLDVRAKQFTEAFEWFLARSDVDPRRVGVLAQSYGVPTILSADTTFAKSFVFVGGAFFPKKSICRSYEELGAVINYEGDTTMPPSSGETTTVGKEFWLSLALFDPIDAVRALSQSVLMIHGDQDTKVSTAEAKEVFAAIPSEHKKLKVFKGGDHSIVDVPRPMRKEFLREVTAWFAQTL